MLFRNKKNGNLYEFVSKALDVTNTRDDTEMVVYKFLDMVFVRESEEFYEKFEAVQ